MTGKYVGREMEREYWEKNKGEWLPFKMPFLDWAGYDLVELEMYMNLPALYSPLFRLTPDDCLGELWINGKQVPEASFCDLDGKSVNLAGYLHKGSNHIRVVLRDYGGAVLFYMKVDKLAPLFIALRIAMFALIGWYGFALLKFLKAKRNIRILFTICLVAAALMKLYDTQVLYNQYAYDYHDHFAYIHYVQKHWNVPPAQSDWQMYQPPLYYFTGAAWLAFGERMGRPASLLADDMETFAWLLITLSLAVSAWIATMLFPKKSDWHKQYWFLGLVGIFPGVVFLSTRISNDVPLHFFIVLSLAFLIRWWQKGRSADWYIVCALLGLGLLIKSTVMPMFAVLLTCLLLKDNMKWRQKISLLLWGLLIMGFLAEWYFYLRFVVERETFVVGNKGLVSSGLWLEDKAEYYFTFNPIKVLQIPFNHTWSQLTRREYFWEFFYRSTLFGEFNFGDSMRTFASVMLGVLFPISLIGAFGFCRDIFQRMKGNVPVWSFLLFFLGSVIGYRIKVPYSGNQDFRFVTPIIIPMAYYLVFGISMLPGRWLRRMAWGVTGIFYLLCIAFLLVISLRMTW